MSLFVDHKDSLSNWAVLARQPVKLSCPYQFWQRAVQFGLQEMGGWVVSTGQWVFIDMLGLRQPGGGYCSAGGMQNDDTGL